MLPKTKNPQKTRVNLAIYCLSINTYTTTREKKSKFRKTAALSQSLRKMFKKSGDVYPLSKPMKNNSERLPRTTCLKGTFFNKFMV